MKVILVTLMLAVIVVERCNAAISFLDPFSCPATWPEENGLRYWTSDSGCVTCSCTTTRGGECKDDYEKPECDYGTDEGQQKSAQGWQQLGAEFQKIRDDKAQQN